MGTEFIALRVSQLPEYAIQKMMGLAADMERQGEKLIHLEIGEPDFDTPDYIIAAAHKAMLDGHTRYSTALGDLDLRQALADNFKAEYGIAVDPRTEVMITPGSKQAIYCAIMATINPGEEVIIPDPFFSAFEFAVGMAGGKVVSIPLVEALDFNVDPDQLEKAITPKTKMLLLNFPSNPTGATLAKESVKAIAEIAMRHDLVVISDEVYNKFVYEGEHNTVVTYPGMWGRTIATNSFSKTYCMTGWRVGYAIAPKALIGQMRKVQEASTTCAAPFSQKAALHALKAPQESVARMKEEFNRRRMILVDGLNKIPGISCRVPKGAFFAFPNITGLGMSAAGVSELLLKEAKVVTVPGSGFGKYGEGYIRLSYANSAENIQKAVERMGEVLSKAKR